jgi:DNA-binding beta-propeller fold protein YncE
VFVFNRGAHPLVEFDRHGAFVRAWGDGLYMRPHGMRIDPEGNIWTTDVTAHTIMKMNSRGAVLLTLGVKGQPGAWSVGSAAGLLNEPTDVAFAPNGDLLVVEGHGLAEPRVLRFDRSQRLIASWGGKGSGPGRFDIAHSVVVDRTNHVYVADRQNRRVQVFDLDGTFVSERRYAGLPCGLFISPAGEMFMVSGFAGQIVKLDADGRPIAAVGQPGKGLGEFGEAHYLTFGPAGEILVADTINSALHTFVKN